VATDTTDTTLIYSGPAGVTFTPDELLIIWSDLTRIPTAENDEIRRRIHQYLEGRNHAKERDTR
jgi:hypothetical protein